MSQTKDILGSALTWQEAGCSVIPIRSDGTKRPYVEWKPYMTMRAGEQGIKGWFHPTHQGNFGIGIVCGQISGNLEMLELEGRACTGDNISAVAEQCSQRHVHDIWFSLLENGYAEWTPSGGLHLLYRVEDHPVPGNTKVARRMATDEELAANPQDKIKVLAETRGEGGYVIVAPTGGDCHPTGDSWSVAAGRIGQIPTITWEQRCALVEAVNAALDQMPTQEITQVRPHPSTLLPARSDRPGDDFNTRTSWEEILFPHGWSVHHRTLKEVYWTRPGKPKTEGWSATTGYSESGDRLYVWSTSTVFESEKPYDKFSAYTLLEHNGDFAAAAKSLAGQGFGQPRAAAAASYVAGTITPPAVAASVVPVRVQTPPSPAVATGQRSVAISQAAVAATATRPVGMYQLAQWTADWGQPVALPGAFVCEDPSYQGFGRIFGGVFEDTFKFIPEKKRWAYFNGSTWKIDNGNRAEIGARVLFEMAQNELWQAKLEGQNHPELEKWLKRVAQSSTDKLFHWAKSDPRVIAEPHHFDANRHLISLANGVIDLDGLHFQPGHDPKAMLTKQINVSYDKDADAPQWTQFLQQVLPDPEIRGYVQRAIGHTLIGDADRRALFLLHGPSGTGKSQFVRMMELMFGDFAETASAVTFNSASKTATLTNDLNDLRGKRFVSLSELDEGETLNESLVKRLTGGDTAKSRGLYQENASWRVQFVMWMATNHLPRLNSDDNAIWRRVKPVAFNTVIADIGAETVNLAEKIFAEEASGILNWMLEGVRAYQEHGLDDLTQISDAVAAYRHSVDPVAQFIDAATEEHLIAVVEDAQMPVRVMHGVFSEWCKRNGIGRPLGERRFSARMESLGFRKHRIASGMVWVGVGGGSHGLLGTIDHMLARVGAT